MQPPSGSAPGQPPHQPPAPATATPYPNTCYRKSPTTAQRLAAIAPTLKKAELRVLLELTARAEASPHHSVTISSRDLASATRSTRSHLREALQALSARGLITTRQGTATRASVHQVNLLDTVLLGGSEKDPPPASQWVPNGPTPGLFRSHPGTAADPPPLENTGLPVAPAPVDTTDSSTELLDRLLKANPKRVDPDLLATARRFLHGYVAKLAADPGRHPPDDRLVAQFLAIAEWRQLERVLYDLLAERKQPGYSYAWFISVALQRLHGIQPAALKARRAQLRLVSRQAPPATADPAWSQQLLAGLKAGAK
jgi:hypothetical protein